MFGDGQWSNLRSALIGAVVAALVLLSFPAVAAVGSSLILGKGNSADAVTSLSGAATANLRITNSQAGAPALSLQVVSGSAPLKVNSTTRIPRLNADLLDGKHGGAYLLATGTAADADLLDGLDSEDFAPSGHTHPAVAMNFFATANVGEDVTLASAGTLSLVLRCSESATTILWANTASSGLWYSGLSTKNAATVHEDVVYSVENAMDAVDRQDKGAAFTVAGDLMILQEETTFLGHDNPNFGVACLAVGTVTLGPTTG